MQRLLSFSVGDYQTIRQFCDLTGLFLLRLDEEYTVIDVSDYAQWLPEFNSRALLGRDFAKVCQFEGYPMIHNSRGGLSYFCHSWCDERSVKIQWNLLPEANHTASQASGYWLVGKVIEFIDAKSQQQQLKFLKQIFNTIDVGIYWKDCSGRYLGSNDYLNQVAGVNLKGIDDFKTSWESTAENLQANDHEVSDQEKTLTVEETIDFYDKSKHVMLSTKSPLRDNNNQVIGIVGLSLDLRCYKEKKLSQEAPWIAEVNDKQNIAFSLAEMDCIQWMIKGKTAEEIALIRNCSKRTVEDHIRQIKQKTQCYRQFQLGYLLGKYGELFF